MGECRHPVAGAGKPAMITLVSLGKASMDLYPEFVASVEEIAGLDVGYRAKGTVEVLTSQQAREK